MKLSQYAKQQGTSYRTALRWFRDGTIQGYQAASGTIIVTEREPVQAVQKVAMYACVSSSEQRANLERQAERLSQYCTVRCYQVALGVKEIASGINEISPKLLSLLKDTSITRVVVGHRDRLMRFAPSLGVRLRWLIQHKTIRKNSWLISRVLFLASAQDFMGNVVRNAQPRNWCTSYRQRRMRIRDAFSGKASHPQE